MVFSYYYLILLFNVLLLNKEKDFEKVDKYYYSNY